MRSFWTYWRRDQRGLAAVEFAFVLPIMLSMLLGLVELSNALGLRAAVTNMASTAADLIAQEKAATGSDMDNVFSALNAMLYGYSANGTIIKITSVNDAGVGKSPTVSWSCAWGASGATSFAPLAKGATPTLPTGTITPGDGTSVIWAEVVYTYNSPLKYFIPSAMTWTNDFYSKPRRVMQIPFSGTPTSSGATCNS
jgi:Flp pilus assembly protein TadG